MSKIDKIVKDYSFVDCDGDFYVGSLCQCFKLTDYDSNWVDFWNLINDKGHTFTHNYFNYYSSYEEKTLLRLLIVEEFKYWLRTGRFK